MEELLRIIKYIKSCRESNIDCTVTIDKSKTHLILNALTKHIPQKVIGDCCPICGTDEKYDNDVSVKYCPNCGQRLDWGRKL